MANIPGAGSIPELALLLPAAAEAEAESEIEIVEQPPLILVTGIVDDSSSIASYRNDGAIRDAHNDLLTRYQGAEQEVLIRTRFLNGGGLSDKYQPPKSAPRMNRENYRPSLSTPLYRQIPVALDEIEAAVRGFERGRSVYTMTWLMTDGADTDGGDVNAIRSRVESMLATGRHIFAGLGVEDGHTDFFSVFSSMGIPEQWIKVLPRTNEDIRRGVDDFSNASRTVTHMGGFSHETFVGASRTGFTVVPNGAAAPATGARRSVYQTVGGVAPAPQQNGASAVPGAATVGNMAGAMVQRTPYEKGEIPFQQLTWSPVQLAYAFDPTTGRWDNPNIMLPTPFAWDAARSMYAFTLPDEEVGYIIGRGGGENWDNATRQRINEAIEYFFRNHPAGKLYYVPLHDPRSQLSRAHALITRPRGTDKSDVRALRGDVTVIFDDDPAHDRYLQGNRNELELVAHGDRVKLTPGIVFRAI